LWIFKPRNSNQGRGIRLVPDIRAFKQAFISSKKAYLGEYSANNILLYTTSYSDTPLEKLRPEEGPPTEFDYEVDGIIQKYVENPLLFKNKKFDLRVFMALFYNG
jgi:hypothetical protein